MWVCDIFIPFVERVRTGLNSPRRQALLILDGHGSRDNPTALELLMSHNIDVVVIPAHTSHVTQPLDCGVNRAFKARLQHLDPQTIPGDIASTRRNLLEAAVDASYIAMSPITINGKTVHLKERYCRSSETEELVLDGQSQGGSYRRKLSWRT